jgi:hypothetical protein
MNLGSPDDDLIHFLKKVTKKKRGVNPVRKIFRSLTRRRITRAIKPRARPQEVNFQGELLVDNEKFLTG